VWLIVPSDEEVAEAGMVGRWVTLLEKLQELANQSGSCDFGIVGIDSFLYCWDNVQEFEFQVRSPQWGTDNRWDGERGVSFSLARNNMASPIYQVIRGARPNHVYVLAQGADGEREVVEFALDYEDESPWGRVEGTLDAQSVDSSLAISSAGLAEIKDNGPYESLSFGVLETPVCHYAPCIHSLSFQLGDIVTGYFAGVQADCKIEEVTIFASGPVYQAGIRLKVLRVVEEEAEPRILIAGTCCTDGEAWRSEDDGITWALVQSLGDWIEAGTGTRNAGQAVLSRYDEVWRTIDGGGTWALVQQLTAGNDTQAFLLVSTGALIAGASYKFWRSTDDGLSWTAVQSLATSRNIQDLLEADNGDLFAAVTRSNLVEGYIYRSQDDGATWAVIKTIAGQYGFASLMKLADGTLLAGTRASLFGVGTCQVYRSTDDGAIWAFLANVGTGMAIWTMAQAANGDLFAGVDEDLYRSQDGGGTWALVESFAADSIDKILRTSLGNMVLTTYDPGGIWRSVNDGATWSQKIAASADDGPFTALFEFA